MPFKGIDLGRGEGAGYGFAGYLAKNGIVSFKGGDNKGRAALGLTQNDVVIAVVNDTLDESPHWSSLAAGKSSMPAGMHFVSSRA